MSDLLTALGLVLVIEGALWALFPRLTVAALEAARQTPAEMLRIAGVAAAGLGVVIVWLVRG
jgi:hypothetical protein